MKPAVSIVLLNFNGFSDTKHCIESLLFDGFEEKEIIVVDNASQKNEAERLEMEFGDSIRLIRSSENLGFAGGCNLGAKESNAPLIVLLNNDTEVTKGWLEPLVATIENSKSIAVVQPKIRSYFRKNHFDYAGAAGGFVDTFGYPFTRGRIFEHLEEDNGQYDEPLSLHWASGACLVVRKEVYTGCGGLDESFFAYMEEIDFCWRVRRLGYTIASVPNSVIYHKVCETMKHFQFKKRFLEHRNNLRMLMKNLSSRELLTVLPVRFFLECLSIGFYISKLRFVHASAATCALFISILQSPSYLLQRRPSAILRYPGSIVWEHFVMKKRTFSALRYGKNIKIPLETPVEKKVESYASSSVC